MTERDERIKAKRRDFLKLAGIGGMAGAASLATRGKTLAEPATAKPTSVGYRETAHVRKYYKTAKF